MLKRKPLEPPHRLLGTCGLGDGGVLRIAFARALAICDGLDHAIPREARNHFTDVKFEQAQFFVGRRS